MKELKEREHIFLFIGVNKCEMRSNMECIGNEHDGPSSNPWLDAI